MGGGDGGNRTPAAHEVHNGFTVRTRSIRVYIPGAIVLLVRNIFWAYLFLSTLLDLQVFFLACWRERRIGGGWRNRTPDALTSPRFSRPVAGHSAAPSGFCGRSFGSRLAAGGFGIHWGATIIQLPETRKALRGGGREGFVGLCDDVVRSYTAYLP